ncbi:MAG: CPXCG motif-containing cysteine-rich protein [Woeseiaceae bacterium]|nr:CPXCG motif-containing cysteine-rich protein [Woeseiaceae bacterium]
MNAQIVERRIRCPFCGEPSHIALDLSAGAQSYIEDCQVCCQPMHISYDVDDGTETNVLVNRAS